MAATIRGTTYDLEASATVRKTNAAAGIPLPSLAQLKGNLIHPFTVFMHYSMCTYIGCQWNTEVYPPTDFTPPDIGPNATQWFETVKALGATQVCLTVRHVGGFALWPTQTTNYSVINSPWRGGKGDVVADFVTAARAAGISPCLYVILGFDVEANHTNVSGPVYLDHQVTVLTELLTNYGQIDRLWWDNYGIGCCQPVTHQGFYCPGGGTTSTPSAACPAWQVMIDTVRALSPETSMVPGPDGCLVNGETLGGTYPLYHATSVAQNSYSCTEASNPHAGPFFAVAESDFSIFHDWFWNLNDTYKCMNASEILNEISVKMEQGANMIMNVPPNTTGVIEDDFVTQLALVGSVRSATFNDPRAALVAPVSSVCAALSVTIPVNGSFDTLLITEDLVGGQVIGSYTIEVFDASGVWRILSGNVHGKTVGLRLLDSVGIQDNVTQLRFNCSSDLAPPPPPGPPVPSGAYNFQNSAGTCMGIADDAKWPCYTGGEGPFQLCPLVAANCSNAGAAWTPPSGDNNGWTALGIIGSSDAVINVDCDTCSVGTHAKVISSSTCGCASALTFNVSTSTIQIDACPDMCLSNGLVSGALPSCAGSEPWTLTQVHVVPCEVASGSEGWSRLDAPVFPPSPPIATLAFLGAFLQRTP